MAAGRLIRTLTGDYQYYYLFRSKNDISAPAGLQASATELLVQPIGKAAMADNPEELIRDQAWYAGDGAQVFGGFVGQQLVGICVYWFGARYARQAGFLSLGPDEAKLVQVIVLPAWQGRGLGRALIARSAEAMHAQGFARLYARVWHSNRASRHAFARAGWALIGAVLEINPARRPQPWRLRLSWGRWRSDRAAMPPVGTGARVLPQQKP